MRSKSDDSGSTSSSRVKNNFNRIAVRLPFIMVGLAIIASAVVAFLGYTRAESALTEASKQQLVLVAQARRDTLDKKLLYVDSDIKRLVKSSAMRVAMTDLLASVGSLGVDKADIVGYFQKSGSTAAERLELTGAGNKTLYSWRHAVVHPDFVASVNGGGYADIIITDANGLVIYSATKSDEFLENVKDGELAGSLLSAEFAKASKAAEGEVFYSEIAQYEPDGNSPALLISAPVFVEDFTESVFKGVVTVRLDSSFFDGVLQSRENMGETGQTYLARIDGTILSNQVLSDVPTALVKKDDPEVVQKVVADLRANTETNVGFAEVHDQFVLALPLGFEKLPSVIVAKTNVSEALSVVYALAKEIIISGLLVLAVVAAVGIFMARSLSTPLNRLSFNLKQIADGNLDVAIVAAQRKDEIGDIGRAVQSFQAGLIRAKELDAKQEQEQKEQEERVKRVDALNERFDVGVRDVLTTVTDAGGNLETTAKSMASISEQTNSEAQTVSSASEQSLMNLQAVAGAAEELSATVGEIDREVRRSADVSKQAAEKAEAAEVSVNGLLEAAQRIGEVVSLINDIADQTNLLALNATIEAARAGEAGKGFAVVASEVKGLANQTGQATGEISVQIQSVQAETEKAVAAIKEISSVIANVNEAATAIAGAVQEQAVTATDISSNIQQVSSGSSEVAQSITRVSMIASDAGHEAENVLGAANQLTHQSEVLRSMVEEYLENIRTA
ncbi:Methyl-accepting chemotaxis protein McpB [Pseudovibrio axinellae]|uniref:Methyl-accepting chemotaxis protein McpB n=1 Tax=Pseudovibrio axinellae TaxID=989403 RepID=A0A166AIQ8_9HYPH|nr:methyl-accepting chemotaxis protein [Pseudovibrio axinellae]KZL21167.1 Methyl-accepting chemotaxis protein McpB [Pseudovibrio axinellae]SEQ90061.1 Methyl-accepting chemotaxis protein [Pseudovibrio axinellae]